MVKQHVGESRELIGRPQRQRSISNSKLSSLAPHLHVIWLAQDEVSQYGLAAMLDLVPSVAAYEVCIDGNTLERRLRAEHFDVCILPVSSCTSSLAELISRCAERLVCTFPGNEKPPGLKDRTVDHWIPEQRLSLTRLRTMFQQLSGPAAQGTAVASADEYARRMLQKVTERERSVLRLVAHGQSNQQVARSLGISIHGVKRHVSNLLLKFDCTNRTELALAASQLQIDLTREHL